MSYHPWFINDLLEPDADAVAGSCNNNNNEDKAVDNKDLTDTASSPPPPPPPPHIAFPYEIRLHWMKMLRHVKGVNIYLIT